MKNLWKNLPVQISFCLWSEIVENCNIELEILNSCIEQETSNQVKQTYLDEIGFIQAVKNQAASQITN